VEDSDQLQTPGYFTLWSKARYVLNTRLYDPRADLGIFEKGKSLELRLLCLSARCPINVPNALS